MKRAAIAVLLVALATVAVLVVVDRGHKPQYRFAATFDTAKSIVGGQQVKVAGAVVGHVENVDLAPGPKARIEMSVDRRLGPFHDDASCRILPEGLISENYVECDPGTLTRPTLARDSKGVPAIPLSRTTIPVSLQDLINVFSLPTDERLRVLFNELGVGTAGRGQDLNALFRRANPALKSSRAVLAIVDEQREQLADAVQQTDTVLGKLGERDKDVRAFVDQAAVVAETSASHRKALGQSVRDLPAMLDAAQPALRSLDRAASDAGPLLGHLQDAAPGLATLTTNLSDFTRAGVPALRSLASTAATGRKAVRATKPVAAQLRKAATALHPLGGDLDRLLLDLRDRGGLEWTLSSLYATAALMAGYDSISHFIPFFLQVSPVACLTGQVGIVNPGCSRKYSSPGAGTVPINTPECGPQSSDAIWTHAKCPVKAKRSNTVRGPARVRKPASTGGRRRSRTTKPPPGSGPTTPAPATGKPADPASRDALLDFLLK